MDSVWTRAGDPAHREADTAHQAWRAYWEATALLRDRLESTLKDELDLTLADYNLLLILIEAGGSMSMGELANRLVFVPSRLTYRVKHLGERGLVQREAEGQDRRRALAAITGEGRDVFRRAARIHSRQVNELFLDHLDAGDEEMLLRIFTRIGQNLDRAVPQPYGQ